MKSVAMLAIVTLVFCFSLIEGKHLAGDRRDLEGGYKTNAEVYEAIKKVVRDARNGIDAKELSNFAKSVQRYADSQTSGVSREDVIKEISEAAERAHVSSAALLYLLNIQSQDLEQLDTAGQTLDTALKIWNVLADKGEKALEDIKVLAATGEIGRLIFINLKSLVTELILHASENKPTDGSTSVIVHHQREIQDSRPKTRNEEALEGWSVCASILILTVCYEF